MSQLKRNVIAASLAAAGMFAVAAPSVAAPHDSAPQEIKVTSTVGSNMEWERVDGVKWSEAMLLTFTPASADKVKLKDFVIDTLVKPAKKNAQVRFALKDSLVLTDGTNKISDFTISLGGVELTANHQVVVKQGETGVLGINKALKVTKTDEVQVAAAGKYTGFASIVMEGDA